MLTPSTLKIGLIEEGYSEDSANIITSQYFQNPKERGYWGTEEQTKLDIEKLVRRLTRTH